MAFDPIAIALTEAGPLDPYRWRMTEPLTWREDDPPHRRQTVEAGPGAAAFTTDLASVPRWLTWLFPRYGKYTKAAVLHDYLCKHFQDAGLTDRSDADEIFRIAMKELGVPWARRWLMWTAVSWATLKTGLIPGRGSKPLHRNLGRILIVSSALLVVSLVWNGTLGQVLDDPSWRWARWGGVTVGMVTTLGAAFMISGMLALDRFDRWWDYLRALGMTIASLPLLAAGLVVGVLLVGYLLVEDAGQGFVGTRAIAKRIFSGRAPTRPKTPRAERIDAMRRS